MNCELLNATTYISSLIDQLYATNSPLLPHFLLYFIEFKGFFFVFMHIITQKQTHKRQCKVETAEHSFCFCASSLPPQFPSVYKPSDATVFTTNHAPGRKHNATTHLWITNYKTLIGQFMIFFFRWEQTTGTTRTAPFRSWSSSLPATVHLRYHFPQQCPMSLQRRCFRDQEQNEVGTKGPRWNPRDYF